MLVCFFTKESAVSYPFVFLLYYFLAKDSKQKIQVRLILLWIASMAFFFYMRRLAGNTGGGVSFPFHISPDASVMMFDYCATLLFLKTPFAAVVKPSSYILGSITIIACFYFAFFEGKKFKFNKINLFYFLLPVLVTAPSIVAGERLWYQGNRIYPMCFAFTVLVFVFLKRFIENKKTKIFALCAAAVFIGTSSYISYARADVFKDGLSFFGEILKESPQHVQARKFHALAHSKNGDIGYAIEELRRLNEDIGFDFDETNYFLAFWLFIDEKYEEAAEIFDLMIKKKQIFNGQPYAGAALSNYFLGKREESLYYLELFAKAANIAPAQAKQYFESYYAYVMRQKEVYLQK